MPPVAGGGRDRRHCGSTGGNVHARPIVMSEATGLALVIAALWLGVSIWGRRRPAGPSWVDVGWVLGIGTGYYVGCWMLEIRPRWPIREDLDRLLGLVIPAALLVELLVAVPRLPRWLIWLLRLALAGLGARVLLHGSMYLSGSTRAGIIDVDPDPGVADPG